MEQKVIEFIATETGVPLNRINPATSLFLDLGVAGNDGDKLIKKFGKDFSVDITGFDAPTYFGKEGGNPLMLIIKTLRPKILPLTIADLVRIAEHKVWA